MGLKVKDLKTLPPGSHRDQPNLFLMVKQDGEKTRRTWVFRYYNGGSEHQIGLGSFTKGVTLDAARNKALRLRQQLADGLDPAAIKQSEKAARKTTKKARIPSFKEIAEAFIADQESKWDNTKHRDQWVATLETYAYPILGKMQAHTIKREHLIEVMEQTTKKNGITGKFWQLKWETCDRVRSRIEQVLDFATVRDLREGPNPAEWKGNLAFAFPSAGDGQKGQHANLPYSDLPDFMIELREREGSAARALEFLILTAARTGEVLGARWSEIDLNTGIWTVPKERMKTRKTMKFDHRVPLSSEAIALLKSLLKDREVENPFVFPGPVTDKLSGMALLMLLRRMGVDVTAHGFRSTFKLWAVELTDFPDLMSELALSHTIGDEAYRAYMRTDLIEKRRAMMQAWANFCGSPFEGSNIITFKAVEKAA